MVRTFPLFLCCFVTVAYAIVQPGETPANQVLVEICESDIPRNGSWPTTAPSATERFSEDAFGLFELPQKYISTGVRADRAFPTLVRATAQVSMAISWADGGYTPRNRPPSAGVGAASAFLMDAAVAPATATPVRNLRRSTLVCEDFMDYLPGCTRVLDLERA